MDLRVNTHGERIGSAKWKIVVDSGRTTLLMAKRGTVLQREIIQYKMNSTLKTSLDKQIVVQDS